MELTLDGVTHDVDFDNMSFDEACLIEDVTGFTFAEWVQQVSRGSAKGLRALALVLTKRVNPLARWEDIGAVDFGGFLTSMAKAGATAGADNGGES